MKRSTILALLAVAVMSAKAQHVMDVNTKKMGAQTAEANMNAGLAAARQICDFFATGNTRFQVNK